VRLATLATLHVLVLVAVAARTITVTVHLYLLNRFLFRAQPEINGCHILNSRCQCGF
jgi:hypothetical protein